MSLRVNEPKNIIVHTALFEGVASIADIDGWHKERGFKNPDRPSQHVGYHAYIRKDGTIEKGREEHHQGAHCRAGGMNFTSLGLCLEGHGDYEDWTPEQTKTFLVYCESAMARYSAIGVGDVKGHGEVEIGRGCPGKLIDMEEKRQLLVHDIRRRNYVAPDRQREIEMSVVSEPLLHRETKNKNTKSFFKRFNAYVKAIMMQIFLPFDIFKRDENGKIDYSSGFPVKSVWATMIAKVFSLVFAGAGVIDIFGVPVYDVFLFIMSD